MTTFIDFKPSSQQVFQFQPTLDGNGYNCRVTWNFFGQRYYVDCYALDGTRIFSLPLVGSPGGKNLETCVWDGTDVVMQTSVPHRYKLGTKLRVTVTRCVPDSFNGDFEISVQSPNTVSYPQNVNPGMCTTPGLIMYNINLAQAYFKTSTLVYRTGSNQFEVTP